MQTNAFTSDGWVVYVQMGVGEGEGGSKMLGEKRGAGAYKEIRKEGVGLNGEGAKM